MTDERDWDDAIHGLLEWQARHGDPEADATTSRWTGVPERHGPYVAILQATLDTLGLITTLSYLRRLQADRADQPLTGVDETPVLRARLAELRREGPPGV